MNLIPLFTIAQAPEWVFASVGRQELVIVAFVMITVVFAILRHYMKRSPRKTKRILFLIWLACMAGTICILYNLFFS